MPLQLFKCDEVIPERKKHCYIKMPGEEFVKKNLAVCNGLNFKNVRATLIRTIRHRRALWR